jgi:rhamnogalacturonan endolyase
MRLDLQGPSVLTFTDNGAAPNSALFARNVDWGWMDMLEISGWVLASGRGSVAGVGIVNVKAGTQYVVSLKNNNGQYWTKCAGSGTWRIDKVLPGTYTLIVWKNELEVYTGSVTISAGAIGNREHAHVRRPGRHHGHMAHRHLGRHTKRLPQLRKHTHEADVHAPI